MQAWLQASVLQQRVQVQHCESQLFSLLPDGCRLSTPEPRVLVGLQAEQCALQIVPLLYCCLLQCACWGQCQLRVLGSEDPNWHAALDPVTPAAPCAACAGGSAFRGQGLGFRVYPNPASRHGAERCSSQHTTPTDAELDWPGAFALVTSCAFDSRHRGATVATTVACHSSKAPSAMGVLPAMLPRV